MTSLLAIRAIVRLEVLDKVIDELRQAGIPRLTVTRAHAIGAGVDPAAARLSIMESAEYADKALVEFVCSAAESTRFANVICEAAHTGCRGDGILYLTPVSQVVKIRTKATGLDALC